MKQYKYIILFMYKGDNPNVCLWSEGDKSCLFREYPKQTNNWMQYKKIFNFTDKSEKVSVGFYSTSSGEPKTNYYDDLQVRQLVSIPVKGPFSDDQEYVIKAKVDNNVNGEKISDEVDGEAYFYVAGKPMVTIKFPYSDLVIILIIIFIIARLILTKGKEEWE
jgi:hypothetical protein